MRSGPSVSVVVPVYNTIPFLRETLESLRAQTLQDAEFICIDDCSDDGSRELLKEYENLDPRFKMIYFPENKGTSQARKEGTLLTSGRYVMYLDGDDTFTPEACAQALAAIEKSGTDMLQFGTKIVAAPGISEQRVLSLGELLNPYEGRLEGDLVNVCFAEKKFGFNLWNKIYRGDLCRKAAAEVADGRFPRAQDVLLFFLIAVQCNTYVGIPDELYVYNFGKEVTGGDTIDETIYEKVLQEKNIADALYAYAEKEGKQEAYKPALEWIRDHFLHECCMLWAKRLNGRYRQQGLNRLIEVWGARDVFCKLAADFWYSEDTLASELKSLSPLQYRKRSGSGTKTVAAYYRCIKNGGAQRVVAMLASLWASMRDEDGGYLYNVVLITDENDEDIPEYPLDPRVQRAYLPPFQEYEKEKFGPRFDAWQQIITRYRIDIVADSLWVSNSAFWDMLAVKSHPTAPAFVMHIHSTCYYLFQLVYCSVSRITARCSLCDAVVTLSECDTRYYSAFCPNTREIVNPINIEIKEPDKTEDRAQTVIWVGRISREKQPLDAVQMMKELLVLQPKARLLLVGSGDEKLTGALKQSIAENGLNEHITLTGFTEHPSEYYAKASVFISTSQYEGFSLVHCEAMAHSLPVVSYDMPYLTVMRDGRGIIPVPQGHWDMMAYEVSKLMDDPGRAQELGRAAKAHADDLMGADIGGAWKEVFRSVDGPQSDLLKTGSDETDRLLLQALTQGHQAHVNSLKAERDKLRAENAKIRKERDSLKKQNDSVKRSKAFRLGRLLLSPFSKMRRWFGKGRTQSR